MANSLITGTGVYTPPFSINNNELVTTFNSYVDKFNLENSVAIKKGEIEPLLYSSEEFIEKASGIKSRYVMDKQGLLDVSLMRPRNLERSDEEQSIQCEMAVCAAIDAMERANITSEEIDAVFVACSNMPRAYPALSIEIQHHLGIKGFALDLNGACSSATFGIETANNAVSQGKAKTALVVSPEICSAHINFRDRDAHFIFGDACTAIVLQNESVIKTNNAFKIIDTRLKTSFSNNIRNNFGFLNVTNPQARDNPDKLFKQQGRKVFKEVVPMVVEHINKHLSDFHIQATDLSRLWLHQANSNMNNLIVKKLLGKDYEPELAPIILDEYANTSSAGSIIAFHKFNDDLESNSLGVICAFGAGYSVGSVIIQKI